MADTQRNLLSAFAGIADPELRRLAEKAVKRLEASTPDESLLRSEFAERFFGFLKGFVESRSRGLDPLSAIGVEKMIDLLDFATADFFYENGRVAKGIAQDWMREFLESTNERLGNAADADAMHDEFERLSAEFEVRKQIVAMVEDAVASKQEESVGSSIDWDAKFKDWAVALNDARGNVQKYREDRRLRRAEKRTRNE